MQFFVWIKKHVFYWNLSLKIGVALLLCWALYQQLLGRVDASSLWTSLYQLSIGPSNWYVFLVLLLMPLNWILEAVKWQMLIPKAHRVSGNKAIWAIFSGVTFSIFTPNRTGDYLGRILLVKAESNWNVFAATVAGNICQLIALLSFGWLGLLYYTQNTLTISWQDYKVFLIITCLGTIFLFLSLLYIRRIIQWFGKWRFLQKFHLNLQGYLEVFASYSYKTLLKALGWAALRYWVYALQYLLMLHFAQIEVDIITGFAGIATIFLVQSSIPLPPALGLLARGEIALLIWGPYSDDPIRILAASFGLFIINLTLPALLGLVAIARVNILKSLGYEKNKY